MRKAEGGLEALATFVDEAGGNDFLIGNKLTLADIAIGSMLGWVSLRWPTIPWKATHPQLNNYFENLDARTTFANTRPSPQTMKDRVV